ncbi:MAG TPA: cob(I)yrinic acid a,c-diamide adenosyltransferase [Candidatus Dormibacteraeota bacterium]|nr:cob(I)yrinic acid a,c-diamide adenosyltransferase [Candidatus Dormibacteraeota bacterium]
MRPTVKSFNAGRRKWLPAAPPETIARKSIVTKTGDSGETGLLYGGRVSKTDPRTEAYGTVDEAISALGATRALVKDRGRHATILRVQTELFTVGAELATDPAEYDNLAKHFKVVTDDYTNRVEAEILELEKRVPLPDAFVIPGGTAAAAALDVGRTVMRRAERRIVALQLGGYQVKPTVLRYVNRLSDLLFMLARAEEGSALKPLTGRRVARTPAAPARTPRVPRPRSRG